MRFLLDYSTNPARRTRMLGVSNVLDSPIYKTTTVIQKLK
ncbi:hypothetical protein T08_14792 [Trichinella sp. T8]|nr:hypothetical protein T08_14792 [Trichinella sp. T8]